MPRTEECRPGGDQAASKSVCGTTGSVSAPGVIRLPVRLACPLVRAAYRLHDPGVFAVVERVHPPECCPAARAAGGVVPRRGVVCRG